MRIERIVAGIDFSKASLEAARFAAQHLAAEAELVLVHSVWVPEPPVFLRHRFPSQDVLVQTARRGAEAHLRELVPGMGARLVWTEVRVGPPADRLVEAARDFAAGLIVVGPHGDRPPPWNRLGSTAERLVRSGVAPVLVAAHESPHPPRKVLLAVDERDLPRQALDWLGLFAERFGATITALGVVHPDHARVRSVVPRPEDRPHDAARMQEMTRELDRWLGAVRSDLDLGPERLLARIAVGDPVRGILEAAEGGAADLIVLVSRPLRPGVRAILEGLEGSVLRGAPCAVLVVPDRGAP